MSYSNVTKKAMVGVIFDFNGTLFFDTPFHEQAWRDYAARLCGRGITDEEFRDNIHGRTNAEILSYLLGGSLTEQEIETHAEGKEALYRDICLQNKAQFHLAAGAETFLDELKAHGVPMAIATSSGRVNSEFYIERFRMARWFNETTFVYNDGTMRSKPYPDIYLRAAEAIGLSPNECVIFEDMPSGIAAARAAGAGEIVAVTSSLEGDYLLSLDGVNRVIPDFQSMNFAALRG